MKAIILAAGLGSRLQPITNDTPKSLINVNNKPLIETQIEFLHEIGVIDIYIVTGYLADKFSYLIDKYGVKLIHNEHYQKYNNIYTMSLVLDNLGDSYVIDADVYLTRNFLNGNISKSTYFSGVKNTLNEWELVFDSQNRVTDIVYSNGVAHILSGVSYWSMSDALLLTEKLKDTINQEPNDWMNLYWDDIVKANLSSLEVMINKINTSDWYEIDSVADYEDVLKLFPNI